MSTNQVLGTSAADDKYKHGGKNAVDKIESFANLMNVWVCEFDALGKNKDVDRIHPDLVRRQMEPGEYRQ